MKNTLSRNELNECLKYQDVLYRMICDYQIIFAQTLSGITLEQMGLLEQLLRYTVCDFYIFSEVIPDFLDKYKYSLIFLQQSQQLYYISGEAVRQSLTLNENNQWMLLLDTYKGDYSAFIKFMQEQVDPQAEAIYSENHCHIKTGTSGYLLWKWIRMQSAISPFQLTSVECIFENYFKSYQTQCLFIPIVAEQLKNKKKFLQEWLITGLSEMFMEFEFRQMQQQKHVNVLSKNNLPSYVSIHNTLTDSLQEKNRKLEEKIKVLEEENKRLKLKKETRSSGGLTPKNTGSFSSISFINEQEQHKSIPLNYPSSFPREYENNNINSLDFVMFN